MKKFIFVFIFLTVCKLPLFAEQKMSLAVMTLKSNGIPKIVTNAVTDVIRTEFANYGNFEVVERGQLDKVIEEQELQLTGLTSGKNAVKIGQILSVRKIIIGEISSYGKRNVITLRVVDTQSGVAIASARKSASSVDDLEKTAVEISQELAKRIVQKYQNFFSAKVPSEYYIRGIVPGWGQIYADQTTKGVAIGGAFTLAVGFTIYSYLDRKKKKDDYESLKVGVPASEFDKKYDDYNNADKMFKYSLIGVGLIYVLHWADMLTLSKPNFDGENMKAYYTPRVGETYANLEINSLYSAVPETNMCFYIGTWF